jgi:hypothetical protein
MEQTQEYENVEDLEASIKAAQVKLALAKKLRGTGERNEALEEVRQSLKMIQETLKQQNWGADFDEIKPMLSSIDAKLTNIEKQNPVIDMKFQYAMLAILMILVILGLAGV